MNHGSRLAAFYYIFIDMIRKVQPLESVFMTGAEMRRITQQYATDLGAWLAVPFVDFYRHVCRLPYVPDPENVETVSRPAFTLRPDYGPRDCDDKSVLCASWWHAHGVPVRFVATSCKKDGQLHHVFCQIPGIFIDATYKSHENCIGIYPYMAKVTNAVLLCDWF